MASPLDTPPYDNDNIFARILRGEMPSHTVYEDDDTIAILDIMPRADGHTLVIPKAPSRNILDIDMATMTAAMTTVQKIARAQIEAFCADGITIQQFSESAGGQVIFHTHIHVLPRHDGVSLRPHTGDMADPDLLQDLAEKLRAALAG